ncbi:hypothetical protein TL16_g11446 [Triparma laevis f. inornata]|uniref:Uncharacterized protein n=1 Tax=Triparma laevis f. inornata TaxID=1714386 RepID=A0A9W7BK59_9STRA|nr:hypothetical protein TL16_g11446 [Triparma laevis f. inornata]
MLSLLATVPIIVPTVLCLTVCIFSPTFPILDNPYLLSHSTYYTLIVIELVILLPRLLGISSVVEGLPVPSNSLPIFGHALSFTSTTPWNLMSTWHSHLGKTYTFTLFSRPCISTTDKGFLHLILHKNHSKFGKDVVFTYYPFLTILGGGIVTSNSLRWRKKRTAYSKVRTQADIFAVEDTNANSIDDLSVLCN